MKRLGVFLLRPLDGMPVHRRVTPSIKFAGTHLYTWVERDTVRVKCLSREHNTLSPGQGPVSRKPPEARARKAIAKSRTLRLLTSCFILIFLRLNEVPFIQEVSGVCTSPYLDTDDLKMASWVRKVSGLSRNGP